MLAVDFAELASDQLGYLSSSVRPGGVRLVGCLPMHVPEELFHAAGLLPVVILQREERVTVADGWIQGFFCEWGRSFVDGVVKGSFSFLEGIANLDTCHTVRGVSQIVKKHSAFRYFDSFYLPASLCYPRSFAEALRVLQKLKSRLEDFVGHQITDDALAHSIAVFNRMRRLLSRLYQLRRDKPGLTTAKQVQDMLVAAMTLPKEEFNQKAEQQLAEFDERPYAPNGKTRLFLSGNLCCSVDGPLIELVDSLASVVDDDLYVGARYFQPLVDEDEGPLESLTKRYLNMLPCPTRHNSAQWSDFLVDRVEASGARAVISVLPKFCEPHAIYLPRIERKLSQAGIPHYIIETVAETGLPGQVRTRLEAFVETVE